MTAAHVASEMTRAIRDRAEVAKYHLEVLAIENDAQLPFKQRRKRIGGLPKNPKWATHQAVLIGTVAREINWHIDQVADLAIGQMKGFAESWCAEYPIFKDPLEPTPIGTSLCRLGYPFHHVEAAFDEASQSFSLAPNVFPIPRFPNDGIYTRCARVRDGNRTVDFIETSTAGLKGQSGGPILDVRGHIWAIQSKTNHLPLGFAPVVKDGNKEIVEHQFMHVGIGAHVVEAVRMMKHFGVEFNISSQARLF